VTRLGWLDARRGYAALASTRIVRHGRLLAQITGLDEKTIRRGRQELAGELAEISGGEEPNVLVVIDQAEELITRSGEREQQLFVGLLGGALGEESPLWVMATVRSEFLSSAPERDGLAEVVDDTLMVEPLSRARLPEVIERPAQRAGLDFEAGLVERMVEETTGGDALHC